MLLVKRCCILAQEHFGSLYQLHTLNIVPSPQKFNFLRLTSSAAKGNKANTGDEDKQIKLIKLEIASMHGNGVNAPDVNLITKHHWNELLMLKSKTARQKYYKRLFSQQQKNIQRQLQKQLRKQQLALQPPQEQPHISYSLGKTTFLLRITRTTMNSWRNNRLFRAMQFGEKLIFDCSYDEYMTRPEAMTTAVQLSHSFADNRKDRDPFDLHFCNINFNSLTMKHLERIIPTMRDPKFPMNLHECGYLDLFPRERLVYLTPHCNTDLTDYDPNKIYIVGAMADKTNHEPLSAGKAKELNLEMARLPLDRYQEPGTGLWKNLSLHQMMRIMLDLKRTRKWEVALQHVTKWQEIS